MEGGSTFVDFLDDGPSPGQQTPDGKNSHSLQTPPARNGQEVLERVTAHPLQNGSNFSPFWEASSGTTATTSSSINTASLIQAAAKSILDDSPRSSYKADNNRNSQFRHPLDDESQSFAAETGTRANGKTSPELISLQKRTLPAMPDEQDRKRFVGCLAAVLASRYAYDVDAESSSSESNRSETMAQNHLLDATEQASYDFSDDEFDFEGANNASVSGSFDYSDTTAETAGLMGSANGKSKNNITANKQQQQQTFRRRHRNEINRHKQAINRHRKRRYDVLSRLLLQSATLLELDASQGKCFLPVLGRVLVPSRKSEEKRQQSASKERRNLSQNSEQEAELEGSFSFSEERYSNAFLQAKMDEIDHLRPFLETMGPGAGLRCLTMFLTQHLLHSVEGYDARIRHAVKTLGVLLILHDMEHEADREFFQWEVPVTEDGILITGIDHSGKREKKGSRRNCIDLCTLATRKFESLERAVASKLIQLSREQEEQHHRQQSNGKRDHKANHTLSRQRRGFDRKDLIRGLKIGGTAVAAGTLFAVTGGLAAPGIAAGIAAIAGGTAVTATAAALLTSTAAVTAIFGVGGGGLAAYKMQRRTRGLTEFDFVREAKRKDPSSTSKQGKEHDEVPEAELFSTVCISGWLRDNLDFQRPWGTTPSHPPLKDRLELLERFYGIHSPDHVLKSAKILASWKGEEVKLWQMLRKKYGRDPDHLFPLNRGPRYRGALTHEQQEVVAQLFIELGYSSHKPKEYSQKTPLERMGFGKKKGNHYPDEFSPRPSSAECRQSSKSSEILIRLDSLNGPNAGDGSSSHNDSDDSHADSIHHVAPLVSASAPQNHEYRKDQEAKSTKMPKHLATVWDYQGTYGGEFYTVRWETNLLTELCDSVADLAFDVVSGGTAQLLKYTALSTLMAAVAWPYALVSAAHMIDGTWTLGVERADEAGKELARSLLFSAAGNRPVTLVGFSFGARVIYSCLKELARLQEKWEDFRERRETQLLPQSRQRRRGELREDSDEFFERMREPASIVEDVVLMGLPNHLSISSWKVCRQIVAGRLVNCFSQRDLILSLMFQIKKFGLKPVCGTCAVNVPGVENVDVTDIISGHQDYCLNVGAILKRVRHCEPFQSSAPSHVDSDFNADAVAREVAKLDMK